MSGIDWRLGVTTQPGGNALAAFQQGAKIGEEMRQRKRDQQTRDAVAAYTSDPENRAAFTTIMQNNPELAMRLSDYNDRRQFNSALGDYLAPQRRPVPSRPGAENALPQGPTEPTLPPVQPGASFGEAFAPLSATNALATAGGGALSQFSGAAPAPGRGALNALMPQGGMVPGQVQMPGIVSGYGGGTFDASGRQVTPKDSEREHAADLDGDGAPDLSFLGEPQTPRDQAFLRMVRRDPEKALKIQSTLRDNFLDQLKDGQSFYGIAVEELARVRDDAGWQRALSRLQPYAERLGVDLGETVPLAYPGDDEVEALLERAMPVKDRLAHLLRSADVAADNARADRNTDSLIADRAARRGEVARNNARRDATTRRGQDIRDGTTRRGQDIRGAGGGREKIITVKTPDEARKLAPGTKFRTPDGRIKVR